MTITNNDLYEEKEFVEIKGVGRFPINAGNMIANLSDHEIGLFKEACSLDRLLCRHRPDFEVVSYDTVGHTEWATVASFSMSPNNCIVLEQAISEDGSDVALADNWYIASKILEKCFGFGWYAELRDDRLYFYPSPHSPIYGQLSLLARYS